MRQEIFEQTLFDMSQQREQVNHETKDTNGKIPSEEAATNGKRSIARRKETSFRHQLTFEYLLRHVYLFVNWETT